MKNYEPEPPAQRPTIVALAVVVNILATIAAFGSMLVCLAVAFLGRRFAATDFVQEQLTRTASEGQVATVITMGFSFMAFFFFCAFVSLLFLSLGLVRGHSVAWYGQMAVCVLFLFYFPVGTVMGVLVIWYFLRDPVRRYFSV